MNAGNIPLFVMQQDCNAAVAQVTKALQSGGYLVLQSFDLQSAIKSIAGGRGSQGCVDRQMVVLLVYGSEGPPAALIFDGNPFQTLVHLGSGPVQPVDLTWIERLNHLLPEAFSLDSQMGSFVGQDRDIT